MSRTRNTSRGRRYFSLLTPTFPDKMFDLETDPRNLFNPPDQPDMPLSARGQRGLIVSPPKAGKTMLLKNIANAITTKATEMPMSWSVSSVKGLKKLPI